jgi:uncharacterized protein
MTPQLTCPKCTGHMARIEQPGAECYRCADCFGLWFNIGEQHRMAAWAEAVDIGPDELGKKLNRVDNITCPKCRTGMLRMVDAKQPHIWYESCQLCFGRFYDAGEFRDFAEYGFRDYLKQFTVTARS